MNRRDEEIFLTITSSHSPIDFFHWITLLNFFNVHKEELDLKELKILVDNYEECRVYFNQNNTDPIERSDTSPNVYEYLAEK